MCVMYRLVPAFRILVVVFVWFATIAPAWSTPLAGREAARISVTMYADAAGTIHVPSPFAIVPDTHEIALCVPESDGVFLLRGRRILHHFPLVDSRVHDLEATSELLVAGRRPEVGRVTVDLEVIDLVEKRSLQRVQSANPFLRVDGPGHEFWRVILSGNRVGVYHPAQGASYPLWIRNEGMVESADQLALASPGTSWGREIAWVPQADGSLSRWERGRTERVAVPDDGEFLDSISDDSVLLLAPSDTVRVDTDGGFLLARHVTIRFVKIGAPPREFRLETTAPDLVADRIVMRGRVARVRDGSLYWIFAGPDYLEVRTLSLAEVLGTDTRLGPR